MSERVKYVEAMLVVCPHWFACATDANGHSGGLEVLWNPNTYDLVAYNSCACIIMFIYKKVTNKRISITNIYASYTGRRQYWDKVTKSSIFGLSSIIIARDLNFSMGPIEIWGTRRERTDCHLILRNG